MHTFLNIYKFHWIFFLWFLPIFMDTFVNQILFFYPSNSLPWINFFPLCIYMIIFSLNFVYVSMGLLSVPFLMWVHFLPTYISFVEFRCCHLNPYYMGIFRKSNFLLLSIWLLYWDAAVDKFFLVFRYLLVFSPSVLNYHTILIYGFKIVRFVWFESCRCGI